MCGLAGLLYGIDMGLVAAALPYIRATSGFTESQLSGIVAAVMLGCIPGTMCAAWVAEKAGRLASLKATALVFAVAVPVICLSDGNFWIMFTGRLLQGAGCGFMGSAAALYVVECASSENRGRGMGMLQLVLTVGLVVAALIGLGAAIWSSRALTRHFNGETELSNMMKALLLLAIMFLVTSSVSICGPIGFISLGVPNLSRIVCKSTDIRKHYLISSAMGVGLLLVTYLVVKYVSFGIYLPISATMAIIALPLMAILFVRK
jgi:MFS family permease